MTIVRIMKNPTSTLSFRLHLKIPLQSKIGEVVKATLQGKKGRFHNPASFLLRRKDKSSAHAVQPIKTLHMRNLKGKLSKKAV